MTTSPQDVFGLFAKWPEPGKAKTRLAAETSPEFALRVARALLEDSLTRYASLPARRVLVYSPPDRHGDFAQLARGYELVAQVEGDLGTRMRTFLNAMGAARVVLMGTDSPTVDLEVVRRAFAELTTHDLVIGPANDGGYYLLGCSRFLPTIFEGIDWGSDRVLRQTLDGVPPGVRWRLLPEWYDVDTLHDWEKCRADARDRGDLPKILQVNDDGNAG